MLLVHKKEKAIYTKAGRTRSGNSNRTYEKVAAQSRKCLKQEDLNFVPRTYVGGGGRRDIGCGGQFVISALMRQRQEGAPRPTRPAR